MKNELIELRVPQSGGILSIIRHLPYRWRRMRIMMSERNNDHHTEHQSVQERNDLSLYGIADIDDFGKRFDSDVKPEARIHPAFLFEDRSDVQYRVWPSAAYRTIPVRKMLPLPPYLVVRRSGRCRS